MKKYNLTMDDLPAFPQKEIDYLELVEAIGRAKLSTKKQLEGGIFCNNEAIAADLIKKIICKN